MDKNEQYLEFLYSLSTEDFLKYREQQNRLFEQSTEEYELLVEAYECGDTEAVNIHRGRMTIIDDKLKLLRENYNDKEE